MSDDLYYSWQEKLADYGNGDYAPVTDDRVHVYRTIAENEPSDTDRMTFAAFVEKLAVAIEPGDELMIEVHESEYEGGTPRYSLSARRLENDAEYAMRQKFVARRRREAERDTAAKVVEREKHERDVYAALRAKFGDV